METSKPHNPMGLHGLLQGHLYLFLPLILVQTFSVNWSIFFFKYDVPLNKYVGFVTHDSHAMTNSKKSVGKLNGKRGGKIQNFHCVIR
jgi:hypothetical protein